MRLVLEMLNAWMASVGPHGAGARSGRRGRGVIEMSCGWRAKKRQERRSPPIVPAYPLRRPRPNRKTARAVKAACEGRKPFGSWRRGRVYGGAHREVRRMLRLPNDTDLDHVRPPCPHSLQAHS